MSDRSGLGTPGAGHERTKIGDFSLRHPAGIAMLIGVHGFALLSGYGVVQAKSFVVAAGILGLVSALVTYFLWRNRPARSGGCTYAMSAASRQRGRRVGAYLPSI